MSFTYGFYNSVNNDRLYNAEQFSSIFDGIIRDGVYMSIGGKLMVKANSGMELKISSGRAWFNHTWSYNDSDLNITIDTADPLLNRIDAVVLEVDRSIGVRANSFKIVKGTLATNPSRPTLTNTVNVKQYPLAYVYVAAGATSITQGRITNMVGTEDTPFVTGILENISITDIVAQWETQFNQWMANIDAEETLWENAQHSSFNDWKTAFINEMETFADTQEDYFTTWFNSMKGQLTTDAAGHLQLEIDDINANLSVFTQDTEADISSINNILNSLTQTVNGKLDISSKATASQAKALLPSEDANIYMTPYTNKVANQLFHYNEIASSTSKTNLYNFNSSNRNNLVIIKAKVVGDSRYDRGSKIILDGTNFEGDVWDELGNRYTFSSNGYYKGIRKVSNGIELLVNGTNFIDISIDFATKTIKIEYDGHWSRSISDNGTNHTTLFASFSTVDSISAKADYVYSTQSSNGSFLVKGYQLG